MTDQNKAALKYHREPRAGKLEISAIKPLATQNDLSLAYSPGVAAACNAIVEDEAAAADVTIRSNLVGVVTNGSAVLGLGNIGPLAAKPVMEGKAVLFKRFSGIDVFDIEIDQPDVDRFIETVASLEPTFGGINLEDIKAPECFEIEQRLRERMNVPVFHDDQHGTAIIVAAAVKNALKVAGKNIEDVRIVTSGAGAAALACLKQLVSAGLRREHIIVTDRAGVIYRGREQNMDRWKSEFAADTEARTLDEAIADADIFLGLSVAGILKPDMVKKMAERPLILALSNPDPEIMPEEARAAREDAMICTGRSDYPNQVNNVLCFPFIFRGALDVGATTINDAMKLACVDALAGLAQKEMSDIAITAYGGEPVGFGPERLIPRPFEPRLIVEIASAVARAAMDSGVARRPIDDMRAYRVQLESYVYRSGFFMRPVLERTENSGKRIAYAEGGTFRVLQAVQQIIDDGIARPVLVGSRATILGNIHKLGLRLKPDEDVDIVDLEENPGYEQHWQEYHRIMGRAGVTPRAAQYLVRTQTTILAALMLHLGEVDAMIAGVVGEFNRHLYNVMDIIGTAPGIRNASTLVVHLLQDRTLFICDSHVTTDPTAEQIVQTTLLAAEEIRSFGIEPRAALLSHSSFGTSHEASAEKMRKALQILHRTVPELEVEGEMHADAALSAEIRNRVFPNSRLKGTANLLVMPNGDAANIAMNLLKVLGGGVTVGPILMGMDRSAHVMSQSATVRSLVNMSAVAVGHAQKLEGGSGQQNS